MNIPGIKIDSELHRSRRTITVKGVEENGKRAVVVKLLNEEFPSPQKTARFRKEYQIISAMKSSGVIKAYDLIKVGKSLAMILEDFGGIPLNSSRNPEISIGEFLKLAIKTTGILDDIHQRHIVHKDINPTNILINSETDTLKIIDFGISSKITNEQRKENVTSFLEGSLPYISPEQTGRTNRKLDYRTDFYSLGVTLYEYLTGELPLQAEDVMGWVHCHIATAPISASQRDATIPLIISELLEKLMAKDAEDRYQSARGLLFDLEICQREWIEKKQIAPFTLGSRDISENFQIPQKLYGRQGEIDGLLSFFEATARGQMEFLTVAGYSGVGKSVLIQEVQKSIVKRKGFFLHGKFDQYQRDIPYSALAMAFKGLVQQLLGEDNKKRSRWREEIINAIKPNGKVLLDLVPELEDVIGEQQEVQELPSEEAKNRFLITFVNFIKIFARAEHPLVIFLDDLHWSDGATLSLLQNILTSFRIPYLFVIGAYRDNLIDETHPLQLTLDTIDRLKGIRKIKLKPLRESVVGEIIGDTLHCSELKAEELTSIIFQKTRGNPFFVNEMLKNLYHENHLRFSHTKGCWEWDLEKVRDVLVSDNVLDLMIQNIRKLSAATQQVLQIAACLGNVFDLRILSFILDEQPEETAKILREPIQLGFILSISDQERILIPKNGDNLHKEVRFGMEYRFQHDRLQQAAYSLIKKEEQEGVHLMIGRLLIDHLPKEERKKRIIDIVRQINEGRKIITDPEEKEKTARLNLEAGKRAIASTAFEPARQYFSVALEMLTRNHWTEQYELAFEIYKGFSECSSFCGDFKEADQYSRLLLEHSRTALEKAAVLRIRTVQLTTRGKLQDAIKAGIEALAHLQIQIPEYPSKWLIKKEQFKIRWNLGKRKIKNLVGQPMMSDPENQLSMNILMEIIPPAYNSGRHDLFALTILLQVNLSLKFGNTPSSSFAYACYGLLLQGIFNDPDRAYQFGKLAVQLSENYGEIRLKSRTLFVYTNFIHGWNQHWQTLNKYYQRVISAGLQVGDLYYSTNAASYAVAWFPGVDLRQGIRQGERYLDLIKNAGVTDHFDRASILQQRRRNLCGLTKDIYSLSDENFDEFACLKRMKERGFNSGVAIYYVAKLQTYIFYDNYPEALKHLKEADTHISSLMSSPILAEYSLFAFLIYSTLYSSLGWQGRMKARRRMKREYSKIQSWSRHNRTNFLHMLLIMQAEKSRLRGHYKQTVDLYNKAITAAKENGFLRFEALANELAAKFYLSLKQDLVGGTYLKESRYAYLRWGATAKVKHLEDKYKALIGMSVDSKATWSGDSAREQVIFPTTISLNTGQFVDLKTITLASQVFSGEKNLGKLLDKMINFLLQNAGASRAVLLLPEKDSQLLYVQAETDLDKKTEVLQSTALMDHEHLPKGVIHFVAKSHEEVLIGNVTQEHQFKHDPYFQTATLKSLLCLPVINQAKLVGIIYLENGSTSNAFTTNSVDVLQILASQAATAIENSFLYFGLLEKNRELEQQRDKLEEELLRGTLYKGGFHKIENNISNIVYFESWEGKAKVWYKNNKSLKLELSLSLLKKGLAQKRIHFLNMIKSYIINPKLVKNVVRDGEQYKICFSDSLHFNNINISRKVAAELKTQHPEWFE